MSASDAILVACLAGVRSCALHANEAADAWGEAKPMAGPLTAADSALSRARNQATALRGVLPAHARRVRLVDRAVERAREALTAVRALPGGMAPGSTQEAQEEAEEQELVALDAVERALGAVTRAVEAADVASSPTGSPKVADSP